MSINFQLRQVYDFDVYPSSLIGNNFKGVTILAIMDRQTANKEVDVQALHIQIFPLLPANSAPNDPDGYDYVKIKTQSGETTILGMPWIKADTVRLVESRTIMVKIGGVASADIIRVRDALAQNGFSNVEISIV